MVMFICKKLLEAKEAGVLDQGGLLIMVAAQPLGTDTGAAACCTVVILFSVLDLYRSLLLTCTATRAIPSGDICSQALAQEF